jgi:phospholipase/carboxylesterase
LTSPPRIDGPRLAPLSGRPAKHLVVLLHGYGANGRDLIDIGRHWAYTLPEAAFVSPDAPEPCIEAPMGRQWFGLTERSQREIWDGVTRVAPALNAFIDAELQRHALGSEALALVGFSQGTMLALHVGLRRGEPLAGIVGYSGLLAGAEHLPRDIRSRPPVLLVHGEEDPMIPAAATLHAANSLAAAGVNAEWHIRPGLGHGIDNEGLDLGAAFLRCALGIT